MVTTPLMENPSAENQENPIASSLLQNKTVAKVDTHLLDNIDNSKYCKKHFYHDERKSVKLRKKS